MTPDPTPLVSIVTPCLNRADMIAQAVESVLTQDYQNFEHIIVDGGSTDGTLEVLNRYPHLNVISEPDHGMYDALNKGNKMAHGEIIGHLNTDDVYGENCFAGIVNQFNANPGIEAVAGAASIYAFEDNSPKVKVKGFPPVEVGDLMKRISTNASIFNAWFFRHDAIHKVGLFNSQYRIAGDSDFMVRVYLANIRYKPLNQQVYYYRSHPDSLTISGDIEGWGETAKEILAIAEKYLNTQHSPEFKNHCRLWYKNATSAIVEVALRKNDFSTVIRLLRRSLRYDPVWTIAYTKNILFRLVRGKPKTAKKSGSAQEILCRK